MVDGDPGMLILCSTNFVERLSGLYGSVKGMTSTVP